MRQHNAARGPVVGRSVESVPAARRPGFVSCPSCGQPAKVTKNGRRLGSHSDRGGVKCPQKLLDTTLTGSVKAPPVRLPERRRSRSSAAEPAVAKPPSRLEAGSNCEDCGRWLPGERRLCGRCSVAREKARRKR